MQYTKNFQLQKFYVPAPDADLKYSRIDLCFEEFDSKKISLNFWVNSL